MKKILPAVTLLITAFFIFHHDVIFCKKTYVNLWIFKNHLPFKEIFPKIYNFLNQSSDLTTHYLPNKFFIAEALRNGSLPLWNPYILGGFPLFENGSAAPFSPLHLLLIFFSPYTVNTIHIAIIFLSGGILLYLLLNRYYKLCRTASLSGSLIYMFCPFLMENIDFDTLLGFIWSFPLLLILCERCLKKMTSFNFVSLAFGVALSMYTCHMHVVLNNVLLLSIYAPFRIFSANENRYWKAMGGFALSGALFLGLSAIQWLPFLEFLFQSQRGLPGEPSLLWTIPADPITGIYPILLKIPHIQEIVKQIFSENLTLGGRGVYTTLFSFVAGIALSILAIRGKLEKIPLLFVSLFLFYYLASLFSFDRWIPFYSLFMPRFWMIFILASSVLSAFAVDLLIKEDALFLSLFHKTAKIIFYIAMMVTSGSLLLTLFFPDLRESVVLTMNGRYSIEKIDLFLDQIYQSVSITTPFILLPLFLSLFFLFLKRSGLRRQSWFGALFLIVILIDLWTYGYRFRPIPIKQQELFTSNPALEFLKKDPDLFRFASIQNSDSKMVCKPNLGIPYLLYDSGGQESVIDKTYLSFAKKMLGKEVIPRSSVGIVTFKELDAKVAGKFNIKYVIASDEKGLSIDGLEPVFKANGVQIYKNSFFMPRAYLMSSDQTQGKTKIVRYEPNRVEIKVDSPQNDSLILADTYFPGWKAYVNGKETKITRTGEIFRRIPISQGKQTVLFLYRPTSLRIGIVLFAVTMIFIIIICLIQPIRV